MQIWLAIVLAFLPGACAAPAQTLTVRRSARIDAPPPPPPRPLDAPPKAEDSRDIPELVGDEPPSEICPFRRFAGTRLDPVSLEEPEQYLQNPPSGWWLWIELRPDGSACSLRGKVGETARIEDCQPGCWGPRVPESDAQGPPVRPNHFDFVGVDGRGYYTFDADAIVFHDKCERNRPQFCETRFQRLPAATLIVPPNKPLQLTRPR